MTKESQVDLLGDCIIKMSLLRIGEDQTRGAFPMLAANFGYFPKHKSCHSVSSLKITPGQHDLSELCS
jgi:hypothetical protein